MDLWWLQQLRLIQSTFYQRGLGYSHEPNVKIFHTANPATQPSSWTCFYISHCFMRFTYATPIGIPLTRGINKIKDNIFFTKEVSHYV